MKTSKFHRQSVCACVKGAGRSGGRWEFRSEDVDCASAAGPCALDWPNIRYSPLSASRNGENTEGNVPKDKKRRCRENKEVRLDM